MAYRHIAKNLNRLSRAHERYRQTTDGRATPYSERSRSPSRLLKTESMMSLLTTELDLSGNDKITWRTSSSVSDRILFRIWQTVQPPPESRWMLVL